MEIFRDDLILFQRNYFRTNFFETNVFILLKENYPWDNCNSSISNLQYQVLNQIKELLLTLLIWDLYNFINNTMQLCNKFKWVFIEYHT